MCPSWCPGASSDSVAPKKDPVKRDQSSIEASQEIKDTLSSFVPTTGKALEDYNACTTTVEKLALLKKWQTAYDVRQEAEEKLQAKLDTMEQDTHKEFVPTEENALKVYNAIKTVQGAIDFLENAKTTKDQDAEIAQLEDEVGKPEDDADVVIYTKHTTVGEGDAEDTVEYKPTMRKKTNDAGEVTEEDEEVTMKYSAMTYEQKRNYLNAMKAQGGSSAWVVILIILIIIVALILVYYFMCTSDEEDEECLA